MIRRCLALICLVALTVSPTWAANTCPASNNAVCWQPYSWELGDEGYSYVSTAMSQQGYDFKQKKDNSLVSEPNCRPPQLIDWLKEGVGGFHLAGTHGNELEFIASTYRKDTAGMEAMSDDIEALEALGLTYSDFGAWIDTDMYYIVLKADWVSRYSGYNSANASSFVFAGHCNSWYMSTRWGAYTTCSYNYHATNGRIGSEVSTIYNNLNGFGESIADRAIGEACADCDSVSQDGGTNWVLAPTVQVWYPAEGWNWSHAGPYTVSVEFDTEMKTSDRFSVMGVVNGYTLDDNEVPGYSGPTWLGNTMFQAMVVPTHCPGDIIPYVLANGAVSAVGEHQLDGGGSYGSGQGPNRDNFVWTFQTDVPQSVCDNWATSFEICGAFDDGDMTTVFWQVAYQRGSIVFDVYAGDGKTMALVQSVAAVVVDPDRPAGYSVTVPKTGPVVEIRERDAKGNETRSRPFPKGDRPDELDEIVNAGLNYPTFELNTERPEQQRQQRGGGPMPAVQHPWYIFVSSSQDFLDACLPAINRLNVLQRPTDTVLTTKDPNDVWTALYPYWELWNPGYVRPRVIFVGQAYEVASDPKNILGTYYSPDDTGICYYGTTCVRDSWLVDFDCDDVPDLLWGRIDGNTLAEVQNSVQGFVDVLNGGHYSSPKAFILDGNLQGCSPVTEPDATLQIVNQLYTSHGIPTVVVKDSDFGDCYDLTSRQNTAISVVQGGITEMVGSGYLSDRNRSPALLIQNSFSPRWLMSAVPRHQRVVAWFPGCDFGDGDRANPVYTPMVELWTTAPPAGTQAVFWTSHGRGAWGRAHLKLMKEVMGWRFSGQCWDTYDVVFQAIRSLAKRNPGLINYLGTVHNYGWPVALPDFPTMPNITGVEESGPVKTGLWSAQPNPFTSEMRLWYSLRSRGQVTIDVVDVSGRIVSRLEDEMKEAGPHAAIWSGTDQQGRRAPSGVYFIKAVLDGQQQSARVTLMR